MKKKTKPKMSDAQKMTSDNEDRPPSPHQIRKKIEEILLQRAQDKFFDL
ncbi:hypothetical protein VQ7734_04771 [Vibrio quintilis]|uniref:Uncharacterized protein n=1 Tax=Vibrio quintilis TaxID=1117707 RepID=A0A1M7Z2G9_9VIBR|nr:hypothetical protein [Vibrio quintilis]SHO58995.1 hypothetical protein VQ7734_04771 [Vibrio quintilis]